jgi:hypothetical protein
LKSDRTTSTNNGSGTETERALEDERTVPFIRIPCADASRISQNLVVLCVHKTGDRMLGPALSTLDRHRDGAKQTKGIHRGKARSESTARGPSRDRGIRERRRLVERQPKLALLRANCHHMLTGRQLSLYSQLYKGTIGATQRLKKQYQKRPLNFVPPCMPSSRHRLTLPFLVHSRRL